MKHIEKRFLIERALNDNEKLNPDVFEEKEIKNITTQDLKNAQDRIMFLCTDQNRYIGSFVHKVDGKHRSLPIPDMTLIYFHSAQTKLKFITKSRATLVQNTSINESLNENVINDIFNYFSIASEFIIMLFTSIESFTNSLIPKNYTYKVETAKRTEIYNRTQLFESIDIKTKITKVLLEITNKDFNNKNSFKHIWTFKELRDEIVHTKMGESQIAYNQIVKKLLKFNFKQTLEIVANFMNYYKPDYIKECSCGKDF